MKGHIANHVSFRVGKEEWNENSYKGRSNWSIMDS